MATAKEDDRMENRGLLTEDDRAFFSGEKDTDDPDKTEREKRYRIRRRIEHMADDLDILREAGQDDLLSDFYQAAGRQERLARKVEQLEAELESERDD